jgi:lipopolysaccharide/colanic/teichoic acid biosynthesis glycosyltransferase
MNFVGPRPERPHFVEQLAQEIPYYEQRHLMAPGLTGWAQINYPYGASIEDAKQKLQYDLYYMKNQSLALDATIIFETIKTILFGRGT